jgi:hypothetical protein
MHTLTVARSEPGGSLPCTADGRPGASAGGQDRGSGILVIGAEALGSRPSLTSESPWKPMHMQDLRSSSKRMELLVGSDSDPRRHEVAKITCTYIELSCRRLWIRKSLRTRICATPERNRNRCGTLICRSRPIQPASLQPVPSLCYMITFLWQDHKQLSRNGR